MIVADQPNSLNSHNTENETFKFQTMDDALKHIKTGSYLAKVDIRKAYMHVPVHPSNYWATGISRQFELKENQEFKFAYLYDTKLPFGASKAPGIFHRLSQAITRIMRSQGFTVIAYLDDFLLIEDSYERCLESFNMLIDLLQTLGFSINWGKVVYPCQRLTFLGIEIDTISRRLTLPKRKIAEIRDILQLCLWKTKLTKWELQSLIGKLNCACQMIHGGCAFLRRIMDFCNKLIKPNHQIRLNSHVKADHYWWINHMKTFNGFTEIIDRSPLPQHVFSTDACPTGGGAQFGYNWLYSNWEADFPYSSGLHINKLDVFTVYLAIQRWKDQFKNKWIVIYIDNSCTLTWINKGTASCPLVMSWLRDIFWFSAISNFRITARYINTSDNVNLDTISRLVDPKYAHRFLALIASGQILISNSNVSNNTLSMLP